ncbi:MAG: PIG-L family deacetylase [Bdellovibrionales bacterium]|nr:PIG-L family deacetylase [Bdellovibrionales bacterium]
MTKKYDTLLFGAHPDDIEMGMGGTAIKLVKAGYSVMSISLTQSENSTYGDLDTRKQEYQAASDVIGCDCMMLDFPDSGVENTREAKVKIATVIRQMSPKIIFAPYHTNPYAEPAGIANVDHYQTGAIVRDAVKFARLKKTVPNHEPHAVKKLYFYLLPRNIWPNIIVDVSEEAEQLISAIKCYKTQMDISLNGKSIIDILMTTRAAEGVNNGFNYAERFASDQLLELEADDFFKL